MFSTTFVSLLNHEQMGVGAVFISTLALHRLPTPNDLPDTQQDHLALMIRPIVSFVVLASIIIRKSFYLFRCSRCLGMNLIMFRWLVHSILQPGVEHIEDDLPICHIEFDKSVP